MAALYDELRFGIELLSKHKYEDEHRYLVYAWMRGNYYLYIGMTTNGRARFYNHHVIKRDKVKWNDYFKVWLCKDGAEARELERKFIGKYSPILNKRLVRKRHASILVPEIKIIIPKKEIITSISLPSLEQTVSFWKPKKRNINEMKSEVLKEDLLRLLVKCKDKQEFDRLIRGRYK